MADKCFIEDAKEVASMSVGVKVDVFGTNFPLSRLLVDAVKGSFDDNDANAGTALDTCSILVVGNKMSVLIVATV